MTFSAKLATCFLLLLTSLTQAASITTTGNVEPINPSTWDTTTVGYVGITSQGTLTVNDGCIATNQSFLGFNSNSTGTATLSSNSSIWNSQDFYIGYSGSGELNITEGGIVSGTDSYLGNYPNAMGLANISGNDSTWENFGTLTIGNFGNGNLNITEGGLTSNYNCQLGVDSSAVGIVTVSGNKSTLTNYGSLQVGLEGRGELNITENGLVRVADTLTIDANGNGNSFINMDTGGMLALSGEADGSLNEFFGLVEGTDAIRWWDTSLNDWAPLTTATLGTHYTLEYLTDGILSGYTLLTVKSALMPGDINGDGKVDGSDVTILANNWQHGVGMPNPDATWEIGDLNGDGMVDGSDVTILANNWQAGVNTPTMTTVPEPGTLLILLFGLLALGLVRFFK